MAASGSQTLDALLEGGLALGDNIVWVVDHEDDVGALASSFLAEADGIRRHLCFGRESSCRHPAPADVTHVGGGQVLQPGDLEDLVLGPEIERGARLVLERLDDLVLRWGASEAVRFYRNTCPRLFDRGAIAYWFATSEAGPAVIDGVSRIAQCVFEIRSGQLRVIKAEGRPRRLQGATTKFETRAGVPVVSREHALGRLGEGLRRTRRERNLTQAVASDPRQRFETAEQWLLQLDQGEHQPLALRPKPLLEREPLKVWRGLALFSLLLNLILLISLLKG